MQLIPKVKDPSSPPLSEFRPISLIRCIYNVILKNLAMHLKTVIGKVISDVKSVYVEGRNILDGPLMVNGLLSWTKRVKKNIMLFKVNFDKEFDSINWGYLDLILVHMGFDNKWRLWIRGCLQSSYASVIINGSLTLEFEILKSLRQGDPFSPFLFIIAMEGLNVALIEVRDT